MTICVEDLPVTKESQWRQGGLWQGSSRTGTSGAPHPQPGCVSGVHPRWGSNEVPRAETKGSREPAL